MSLFEPDPPAAPVVHRLAENVYPPSGNGLPVLQKAKCGATGRPGAPGWRTAWLSWATCEACLAAP